MSCGHMAQVRDYYPGDFWLDMKQTLAWLYARQNATVGGWQGNAIATPTSSAQFAECGIVSVPDFATLAQTAIENIVIDLPVGVTPDLSAGPDLFPINFSPHGLPQGNILLNTFQNTASQTVSGRCFALINALSTYRVDVFSRTDKFYYQGSSSLTDVGSGVATWSLAGVLSGAVIAVLYPTTIPQPGVGSSFNLLPAGWVAHSNSGVGKKLTNYKVQVFSRTDIEYLQEDNVSILVQDPHHARAGSSVIPAAGTLTMHILFNDPTSGWTQVFSSLQALAAYKDLPRSVEVPTSDPLYVPDPTTATVAVIQNRSWIYDCALAILTYSAAGNFTAASKIIKQLNFFLDNPNYLASVNLETAEDGLVTRWAKSNPASTVKNLNDPSEPPYGTGNVIRFTSAAAGDSFTYSGAGFPDATDAMIQWEHRENNLMFFVFDISVTTAGGAVTGIQVTSGASGPATYNSGTKIITVPIGIGQDKYRWSLQNLSKLISTLASDTLSSISGFKVTLNAIGNLYIDNLSVGGVQPTGSLSFSYDIYNGAIDQAYIRAGSMAWVCYAYALYMQMSLDYTPSLYLQKMINFLATLKSADADLRNGLYYLGYGKYADPGYQFSPGLQTSVSTEHNIDLYFAFTRVSGVLTTAATQLLKTGTISSSQAISLNSTAATASSEATNIASKLTSNLYISPGTDPGHFAQGASAAGLDTSLALDASGTWAALFCHAVADDTKATECLKFVYQKFYLQNQQILLSSATASYNQAYQQLQTFNGFKPYNDSPGGYSGSPASVWQEGTWGMILALLRLYNVSAVASYFAGVESSLDAFLTKLITGQRIIRSTTGNGSLLNFSLAARGLPWEFAIWPGVSPTAWLWVTALYPSLLLSTATDPATLPYLIIPQGQGQQVLDREGHSSIGGVDIECIDPAGVVKGLAAQPNFVGKTARLRLGFPGQSLGDFVTVSTVQIISAGYSSEGLMRIACADVQRFMKEQIWSNGGPSPWTPGGAAPSQPVGPSWLANSFTVSDKNPRWVQGNPLDIYLAVMQNELGVGQDPALLSTGWTTYQPGNDLTLINPNMYLDVPGILALRNGQFSGDWFEFKITRPVEGKQWLEDQILKVLGLYTIVGADGRMRLKPMKSPQSVAPVMALNEKNTIGLPEFSRLPVVNVVTVRFAPDISDRETAAPEFRNEITFQQVVSIGRYKQQFKTSVEANGLRVGYGGNLRAFVLADRIFKRYAFATPKYKVHTFLGAVQVELGDFVWLNHSKVPDFLSGNIGLANAVCEVIDRKPNFAEGSMEFDLLDTRFMNLTTAYQIAPISAGIPPYPLASGAERQQYMFISLLATGGLNPDGTPGNTIF